MMFFSLNSEFLKTPIELVVLVDRQKEEHYHPFVTSCRCECVISPTPPTTNYRYQVHIRVQGFFQL